jgi:hypothetical protein
MEIRRRALPTAETDVKHIGRKLLNMDGDTAESTADSGNRCETHWDEASEHGWRFGEEDCRQRKQM